MSLNNVQLTPHLLGELYSDVLIEACENHSSNNEIKFLGRNDKNILIVVKNEHLPFVKEEEFSFLTNILSACKLGITDVALVNLISFSPNKYQQILQQLKSKKILMFGVEPVSFGLPMNFPVFQIQNFDKRIYLHAPTLSEIENEKTLKTKLWTSLKALFSL
ncbi:MAG: hypothetical protein ABR502_04545 [Chitinophagaceae bacterium]